MFSHVFGRAFRRRMRRMFRKAGAAPAKAAPRAMTRAVMAQPTEQSTDHRAKQSAASVRLVEISKAAVSLASLGPRLAELGAELEVLAGRQAGQAAQLAITAAALAGDLDSSVSELRTNAAQVDESLSKVQRLSEGAKRLSVAAGAGSVESGDRFSILAREVQALAEQSREAFGLIEARMGDMRHSIVRVEKVAEHSGNSETERAVISVNRVNEGVQAMAAAAGSQLERSRTLHVMSEEMKSFADQALVAVGAFRFEIHRHAGDALEQLTGYLRETRSERNAIESVITGWLKVHPAFELAYVTNEYGRQVIDNLVSVGGEVEPDISGYDRDWSQRAWFLSAKATPGVHCSDLYRSSATKEYCFTVSASYSDREGRLMGVVAADVNFRKLLEKA